jgi:hypothetical protein
VDELIVGKETSMKLYVLASTVFMSFVLTQGLLSALPAVSEDYSQMAAGAHSGKRLNQIINPEDVSSISMIENRGKGGFIAPGFFPQWNSDELIQNAFVNTELAENWGLSATERTYARYALITKKGDLFLLEVVCDSMTRGAPTALLLHGRGFGCRIKLPQKTTAKAEDDGR